MRVVVFSMLVCFFSLLSRAQDIGVVAMPVPNSGCELTNSETVAITVFNYGADLFTPFDVSYSINGGPVVTETVSSLSPFASSGTYTHTFVTNANLPAQGTYNFVAYTTLSGDLDLSNDTIYKQVVSDATSVGGTISSDQSVCAGANAGTLNLAGHTGNDFTWESSTDGGSSWSVESTGITSLGFSNVSIETVYRVTVTNGLCPSVFSGTATLLVDPVTVGGTLSGPDTVCVPPNSGTITLVGQTGTVEFWEYSDDNGASWNNVSNTTSMNNFTDLTLKTLYRASVKSGVCPSAYSSTQSVFVKPGAIGGSLSASASNVCVSGNSGVINLTGEGNGVVDHWEFSTNGGSSWNNIANTSNTENFTNLTVDTWYRVIVQGCNTDTSSIAVVVVDPISDGGTLPADFTVCGGNNSGTINLAGEVGTISGWEASTNGGATWSSLGETTNAYSYSNISIETLFRVIVGGSSCPSDTSSTTNVFVDNPSIAGTLTGPTNVCVAGNSGVITAGTGTGMITDWLSSTDGGGTWASQANTASNQIFVNITQTTDFIMLVQNGVCPVDTSRWTVVVDALSDAGTLANDMQVCYLSSGTIALTGTVATTILWKSSPDSLTWPALISDSLQYDFSQILNDTYYMAIATNGSCPPDTSNVVLVDIYDYNIGTSSDTLIEYAAQVEISAYGGNTYLWTSTDSVGSPNDSSTIVAPIGTNYFYVEITDSNNCVYRDSVLISVGPQGTLKVANLVTRNNDGYNDTWNLIGLEKFPNTRVEVFNINGMLVFEADDYNNEWDGTFDGNPLPDGTYYYVVTTPSVSLPFRGYLTLLSE